MIRRGEIQSNGNRKFGQTPIPARLGVDKSKNPQLRNLDRENFNGKKPFNPFSIQDDSSIHSRLPRTAGRTVEKDSVAYQKYSHGLKWTPT